MLIERVNGLTIPEAIQQAQCVKYQEAHPPPLVTEGKMSLEEMITQLVQGYAAVVGLIVAIGIGLLARDIRKAGRR